MSAIERLDAIKARANAATQALRSGTAGTPPNVDGLTVDGVLEIVGEAAEDVPALVAALRAILAIHGPVPYQLGQHLPRIQVCDQCATDFDDVAEYPCDTVRAIEEALA